MITLAAIRPADRGMRRHLVPPHNHPHSGETRWLAAESAIVRNSQGIPVALLGVTRDITHHKQAEQALAERNAQLALAGQAALVGSYVYDVSKSTMQVAQGYEIGRAHV